MNKSHTHTHTTQIRTQNPHKTTHTHTHAITIWKWINEENVHNKVIRYVHCADNSRYALCVVRSQNVFRCYFAVKTIDSNPVGIVMLPSPPLAAECIVVRIVFSPVVAVEQRTRTDAITHRRKRFSSSTADDRMACAGAQTMKANVEHVATYFGRPAMVRWPFDGLSHLPFVVENQRGCLVEMAIG